jgi:hypothetical protein
MKRLLVLVLTMIPFLAFGQETDYPDTAEEVARRFAVLYESGNDSTALYVTYHGKHVNDMGETVEAIEKELLPEELKKNRKNPASVVGLTVTFSQSDPTYKQDTYYASYQSRNKPHKFALFLVDGHWKVDLSYLWMGDWFDWMPGF